MSLKQENKQSHLQIGIIQQTLTKERMKAIHIEQKAAAKKRRKKQKRTKK